MISTIVKLSEVSKGTGCMLPARVFGECHKCKMVMSCPNDQAEEGRITYYRNRIDRLRQIMKLLEGELNAREIELKSRIA